MKNKYTRTGLLLMLACAITLFPLAAIADKDVDEQKPIRLYATARLGPVGTINSAVAVAGERKAVAINGRAAGGEQALWGGELIEVPRDASARVSFDAIGEATLSKGARVRFSTSISDGGREVLVASLMRGEVSLRLTNGAGAYVEAAGSAFTATPGAAFRVAINEEGRAIARASVGEVSTESQGAQQRFTLRPPAGQSASLSVAARSTRQVQIQVTDENDRPVPDLAIVFSLGDPCLGTLGLGAGAGTDFTERTDNRGIATVPWVTGTARCAGTIIARVQGGQASFTYRAEVRSQGFWTTQNKVLVAAAAAAAGATTAVVVTRDNREPIRPVPPPDVRP